MFSNLSCSTVRVQGLVLVWGRRYNNIYVWSFSSEHLSSFLPTTSMYVGRRPQGIVAFDLEVGGQHKVYHSITLRGEPRPQGDVQVRHCLGPNSLGELGVANCSCPYWQRRPQRHSLASLEHPQQPLSLMYVLVPNDHARLNVLIESDRAAS